MGLGDRADRSRFGVFGLFSTTSMGMLMSLAISNYWKNALGGVNGDFRLIGGLALCVLYIVSVVAIVMVGGEPFSYPLDDTYIHMAIARTIATSGVWGVSPAEPAAASSSPLWTLLLAGAYSVHSGAAFLYVSLLLNMISGCGLIVLLLTMFRPRPVSIALVAGIGFAAALPSLSVLGMEHVQHALLAEALCFAACQTIARPSENTSIGRLASIGLLAGLSVAARYESLFLVAPLVVLSAARLRLYLAAALGLGAALPVLGFGLLWLHNGGWFLPNSLILKTNLTEATGLIPAVGHAMSRLLDNLHATAFRGFGATLIGLAALLVWYAIRRKRLWDMPVLFALSALVATGGHFAFAATGWLFRYEAWLIVLDVTAICLLAECLLEQRLLLALAVSIVTVFLYRTGAATFRTTQAIDDRRVEHLSTAHFVDSYYSDQIVMVNDLGAMAWFAPRTRILDIYGLGHNEAVRLRLMPGGYDSAALRDWAAQTGARIAILQVCWREIESRLPEEWTLVATWRIPRNVVFGDHVVGFFAIAPGEQEKLRRQLEAFLAPAGVMPRLEPPRATMLDGC